MLPLHTLIGVIFSLTLVTSVPVRKSPRPEPIDKLISGAMKSEMPTGRALSLSQGDRLVEMDMMLTTEQFNAIHGNKEEHKVSRIALGDESYRWIGATVPYEISNVFSSADVALIRRALDEWETYTCISFVPRSNQENYVRVISADGCWSHVGMVGGMQELSLDRGGCLYHHTIVHEWGHAIGRHHEQTRPDRDSYVDVKLENIKNDQEYNFDKYDWGYVKNYGVLYDYWSVMHYSQFAFTSNGRRTIRTKDEAYQDVIGTVPGVSLKDIQTANLMYRCSEHCDRSKCPAKAIISEDCKCWCNTGNPGMPVIEWDGRGECVGPDDTTETCIDYNDSCEGWASDGECEANPNYMFTNCRKSCKACGPDAVCIDFNKDCEFWAVTGECESNPGWMLRNCMRSCNVCGPERPPLGSCDDTSSLCESVAADKGCGTYADSMLERCPKSCHTCQSDPEFECRDWHVECKIWQEFGQCDEDTEWMSVHCPKACGKCTGGNRPACWNVAGDEDCNQWASIGECANNRGWMLFNCAKSCRSCGSNAVCQDRSADCDEWKDGGLCTDEEDRYVLAFYCPVSCQRCDNPVPIDAECPNYDPDCAEWAGKGWCTSNPNLMLRNCPKACNLCGPNPVCLDYNDQCDQWEREGECTANPLWMHIHCARSCNTCPQPTDGGGNNDPCQPNPCNGGTCRRSGSNDFTCSDCPAGYGGDRCQDDLCMPNPCANRGTCERRQNGYRCQCLYGFIGDTCENDLCMPNPCGSGGTCERTDGSYRCKCKTGYSGNNCQNDVCAGNQCNTGTCVRREGDYTCKCPTGVSGDRCQNDVCSPNPCNEGKCRRTSSGYYCDCPIGTAGLNCEDQDCTDNLGTDRCRRLRQQGRCETNPGYMQKDCARTCRICGPNAECTNLNTQCDYWASTNECNRNPGYMQHYCRKSCEICKASTDPTITPPTTTTIQPAQRNCDFYPQSWCRQFFNDCPERARRGECENDLTKNLVLVNCPIDCGVCGPKSTPCKDFHTSCDSWAQGGHCENSRGYMEIFCRASCNCCA